MLFSEDATQTGFVQVLIGLVGIWVMFELANRNFLSPTNLTNLALQIVAIAVMAIGVSLVLLIGEIDLSIGSISGLSATIMAALNVHLHVPASLAILSALLGGMAVGALQGLIVTRFGVPSFVVTLGGLIGWQGLQLFIFDYTTAMSLTDQTILGMTNTFLLPWVGVALAGSALLIMGFAAMRLRTRRSRADLPNPPIWTVALRLGFVALAMVGALAILASDRGMPLSVVILLALLVLMDYVTRRTLFGRHIYAVGGDREAAMRVGISVPFITVSVLSLSALFAAASGILDAARLQSVSQSAGGGDLLLNAIAAVVIGGTSLFGGRGSVWSALLGALIIGSISNGMDLLALASPVKLMVTGSVLVAAVVLDATTRRRQAR